MSEEESPVKLRRKGSVRYQGKPRFSPRINRDDYEDDDSKENYNGVNVEDMDDDSRQERMGGHFDDEDEVSDVDNQSGRDDEMSGQDHLDE